MKSWIPIIIIAAFVAYLIAVGIIITERWPEVRLDAISGAIAIGALFGLLYYAYLTGEVARGNKENTEINKANTEINKANLANIYPAFSFRKERPQSQEGHLVQKDISKHYIFEFYVLNERQVPGTIRLDFEFGRKEGTEFIRTGPLIFAESIFEPEDDTPYPIQPNEVIYFGLYINKDSFEKWIANVYSETHPNFEQDFPTLDDKVEELHRQSTEKQAVSQPSKLFIRMKLTGIPDPLTKSSSPYEFLKTFYLKFPKKEPTEWEIKAEPYYTQ